MSPDFIRPCLTKIIATIGPASSEPGVIEKLIDAGVSVFRFNFSHGSLDEHRERLQRVRAASKKLHRHVAVMGDLQGPKIRVGRVEEGGVEVPAGATVIFQREAIAAKRNGPPFRFSSTYERLIDDVEPGQRVLINDGAIRMLVVGKSADEIECTVTIGGLVTSGKGINLPESNVSAPAIGEDDLERVEWAVKNELDFLALSFVRSASEVLELRRVIEQHVPSNRRESFRLPIVAKIELPAAVRNIEDIANVCDMIMVARGDLGVEMDLARVPVIQKDLLRIAQSYGRPGIVATQMLESMISNATPTRAEATDVANAIFDGADAVMLSGETAVGKYPMLAVEHMRRIAIQAESYLTQQPRVDTNPERLIGAPFRTAALAHGVWTVACDFDADVVVVWSQAGGGARFLSQNNFDIPIIAISSDERAVRQMQLYRGVVPVHMNVPRSLAEFTQHVDEFLRQEGWCRDGDTTVLVAGSPIGKPGVTNSLAIHTVGSPDTGFAQHGAVRPSGE